MKIQYRAFGEDDTLMVNCAGEKVYVIVKKKSKDSSIRMRYNIEDMFFM